MFVLPLVQNHKHFLEATAFTSIFFTLIPELIVVLLWSNLPPWRQRGVANLSANFFFQIFSRDSPISRVSPAARCPSLCRFSPARVPSSPKCSILVSSPEVSEVLLQTPLLSP